MDTLLGIVLLLSGLLSVPLLLVWSVAAVGAAVADDGGDPTKVLEEAVSVPSWPA